MRSTRRRHNPDRPGLRRPPLALAACLLAVGSAWLMGFPVVAPVRAFMRDAASIDLAAVPRLKGISAKSSGHSTIVTIEASEPVAYVPSQPDPLTLVLDLRNVRAAGVTNGVTGKLGSVAGVSVEDVPTADGSPLARVRVAMTQRVPFAMRSARNFILIEIDRQPAGPETLVGKGIAQAPAPTPVAGPTADSSDVVLPLASVLSAIRTSLETQGTVVTLSGNGRLAGNVEETGDGTPHLYVDFPNVSSSTPAVTEVAQGPIERIHVMTLSRDPLVTRVVMDLSRRSSYWVQPPEDDSRDFRVVFDNKPGADLDTPIFAAQIGGPRPLPPVDPMTALTIQRPQDSGSGAVPATISQISPASLSIGVPGVPSAAIGVPGVRSAVTAMAQVQGAVPVQAPPPPQTIVPPTTSVSPMSQPGAAGRTFTGQPVILDFQDADLRAVLRTFSEISGLNMVIDPAVDGKVNVSLRDVPWDQALDIILRANKLGYSIDGTIVRIAPLAVLADEEAQRRKLSEEQALAGDLRVLTRSLSYAKAEEMAPLLTRTALTSRGTVQVDLRTNTLIITDLPNALTVATDLIATLDKAQPQVEIEARIVQTTRNFARTLGVQWGFNGRVAQDLGNTTGLAFPNQGTLTGRTGGVQGPIQGEITDHAGTAVNLDVLGASSAIGLALGSVNGAVNLDLALSALEQSGQGRVLSTPRVSTQNNIEAEITQGLQIPIQTVANNTVTVTFKDAALTLKVTPQITASNTVIMKISLENATPDFSRSVGGIPPIDTQRALTQVLVADGETTVIGGIYINNQQNVTDRTPGMWRIPILGWLFKRDSVTDSSKELLIFITPRVTKM